MVPALVLFGGGGEFKLIKVRQQTVIQEDTGNAVLALWG